MDVEKLYGSLERVIQGEVSLLEDRTGLVRRSDQIDPHSLMLLYCRLTEYYNELDPSQRERKSKKYKKLTNSVFSCVCPSETPVN